MLVCSLVKVYSLCPLIDGLTQSVDIVDVSSAMCGNSE